MRPQLASSRYGTHQRAFTLMELLAVIVLMSLVAGIAVSNLGGLSQTEAMLSTSALLHDLDAKARAYARTDRPCTMRLSSERSTVDLLLTGDQSLLSQVGVPQGIGVKFAVRGGNATDVAFDRLGCSPDYELKCVGQSHTIVWSVCGLTGWRSEVSQ